MEARHSADLVDLIPLSTLQSPVRRRLYELVSAAGREVGRDEAAASAGVSRSLAAYHLDKLVDAGLLQASFERRRERSGPGAGRPAKLYRRAQREFVLRTPPRDYQLLVELLVRAAEDDQSGALRATLERVAQKVGRSLGEQARQEATSARDQLKDALRLRGYEPFEEEDGTLRLRNCPFETVANRHPAIVCGLNLRLLDGLIKGLDVRGACALLQPAEGHCCIAITDAQAR